MKPSELIEIVRENTHHQDIEMRSAERKLSEVGEDTLRIQNNMALAFNRIARIRIEEGTATYEGAKRELSLRQAIETELRANLAVIEASITEAQHRYNEEENRLEDSLHAMHGVLLRNPVYAEALAQIEAMTHELNTSVDKEIQTHRDCRKKLFAISASRPFQRLEKRGFGTPEYRRKGISGAIDKWIAGMCNYHGNLSQKLSLESTLREVESSTVRRTMALESANARKAVIDAEYICANITPLADAIARIHDEIRPLKQAANQIHEELGAFSRHEDEHYIKAQKMVANLLSDESVQELVHEAAKTAPRDDDEAAEEISRLKTKLADSNNRAKQLKDEHEAAIARHDVAKRLERRLNSGGLNKAWCRYNDSLDIRSSIQDYMAGRLTEVVLISMIERAQVELPR